VDHVPLGVRLPPCERAILDGSRRNHATGSGGVPYTNNGSPQFFALQRREFVHAGNAFPGANACGAQGSSVWFPDLRKDESLFDIDIMVKF